MRDDHLFYALEVLALEEPIASLATGEVPDALHRFVDAVAGAVDAHDRGAQMGGLPGKETTSTSTP